MKPAPSETAEILPHLRQQLILAQVRIMELEDARDELVSKLSRLDRTLTEMQSIAEHGIAERDHQTGRASDLEQQLGSLRQQCEETRLLLQRSQLRTIELQTASESSERTAAERHARVVELDNRLRAVKSSRSWRWTAPLRSLEKLFRRTPRE